MRTCKRCGIIECTEFEIKDGQMIQKPLKISTRNDLLYKST